MKKKTIIAAAAVGALAGAAGVYLSKKENRDKLAKEAKKLQIKGKTELNKLKNKLKETDSKSK